MVDDGNSLAISVNSCVVSILGGNKDALLRGSADRLRESGTGWTGDKSTICCLGDALSLCTIGGNT